MADALQHQDSAPRYHEGWKEDYHQLKAGTELHRIHLDAFGPTEFNGTDKGSARFSPIRDASGGIIPTIYAAQTFECSVCEITLRCPDTPSRVRTSVAPRDIVHPSDHQSRVHSQLRTVQDINLVSITPAGQRKIGIQRNALRAGPKSAY